MGRPSAAYEPRRAADSVLYQVVRDHYETFAAQAASWRDGEGLPAFIEEEFRGFLRCGWLRAVSMRRVWLGSARPVFVQGARDLSLMRGKAHGRTGRAS